LSALVGVMFTATLGAGNTLSILPAVQNSPDGATWTAYGAGLPTTPPVVATGPTGGGTVRGQANFQVSLTSALRYVRFVYTPTLSAASVDTAGLIGAGFFGGFDRLPAPNA
jgi:hypothetical protein